MSNSALHFLHQKKKESRIGPQIEVKSAGVGMRVANEAQATLGPWSVAPMLLGSVSAWPRPV
jgi:hypothetical protein